MATILVVAASLAKKELRNSEIYKSKRTFWSCGTLCWNIMRAILKSGWPRFVSPLALGVGVAFFLIHTVMIICRSLEVKITSIDSVRTGK